MIIMMSSFRQIDVDRLDPDSVVNQVPEVAPSGVELGDVQALESQVKQLLQSGKGAEALAAALARPPYGSSDQVKDAQLKVVLSVLTTVRASEIAPIVEGLDTTARVVLVKYLYKAMGVPTGQANGSVLLSWLERAVEYGGQVAVVRHITDRRSV